MPFSSPNGAAPDLLALHGAPDPNEREAIGVLGGMGPYAGLDLVRALFDETAAASDQEHLPVVLISYPGRLPDRSTWIHDPAAPNPVPALIEILRRLDEAGCAVAGIPCNTAHAEVLYDRLAEALAREGRRLRIVHLIEAVVAHVAEVAPEAKTVGVLATTSSIQNRLHSLRLRAAGYEAVRPDADVQDALVQPSIFDPAWGLKAHSNPPTARAREALVAGVEHLKAKGAEAVILGCTELPLALPEPACAGLPLVNSTRALARALIRATHPAKLRPLEAVPAPS
ncbi:MAG TPA: amino acid racemase [Rubricoccaceae bacterium]|nr:amino acid racemase [Rubricoccaceae bacterium]